MKRCLALLIMVFCFALTGCPEKSSNIIENADQAAIDAYDAEVEKANAGLGDYKEPK